MIELSKYFDNTVKNEDKGSDGSMEVELPAFIIMEMGQTDQQTNIRGHREVTLQLINVLLICNNICIFLLVI